jgi:hypothetical protein
LEGKEMANLEGIKMKYTVIKNGDLFNADAVTNSNMECVLDSINRMRKKRRKKQSKPS